METTQVKTVATKIVRTKKSPEQIAEAKVVAAEKAAAAKAEAMAVATVYGGNATFVANTVKSAKAYHFNKFTISPFAGGVKVHPTEKGIEFFKSRSNASLATQAIYRTVTAIMIANRDVKDLGRNWAANAAIVAGKKVALPTMSGGGDITQKAVFACLVTNRLDLVVKA